MQGTFLIEADLSDIFLSGANLKSTYLSNTNLTGANLFGAEMSTEQLDKAKSLKGATMPDGSIHP